MIDVESTFVLVDDNECRTVDILAVWRPGSHGDAFDKMRLATTERSDNGDDFAAFELAPDGMAQGDGLFRDAKGPSDLPLPCAEAAVHGALVGDKKENPIWIAMGEVGNGALLLFSQLTILN